MIIIPLFNIFCKIHCHVWLTKYNIMLLLELIYKLTISIPEVYFCSSLTHEAKLNPSRSTACGTVCMFDRPLLHRTTININKQTKQPGHASDRENHGLCRCRWSCRCRIPRESIMEANSKVRTRILLSRYEKSFLFPALYSYSTLSHNGRRWNHSRCYHKHIGRGSLPGRTTG